jgi:hypothetical protein
LSVPSDHGALFELWVRYARRRRPDGEKVYPGGDRRGPVVAAYNLFKREADKVTFDGKNQTIEASGNIVVTNEAGATRRADSLAFGIKNGEVLPLR